MRKMHRVYFVAQVNAFDDVTGGVIGELSDDMSDDEIEKALSQQLHRWSLDLGFDSLHVEVKWEDED